MGSPVKLSVIIPTVGRDSLAAAKASAAGADEIIVVHDQTGDHGYTARHKGMRQATGTHLAFLDDDDEYTQDAIRLFREAACDVPVIFRMDHPQHGILWREKRLEFGNVGTPMFLVPNIEEKLGVWAPHIPGLREPGGDFTFIRGCVEGMGEPVWRPEVVAIVRPDRGPTISIITPWWNHPELEDGYMAAVTVRRPTDALLIVDNASTEWAPPAAIRLDENQGFSPANNIGLRVAETDAVLFLNNDVLATSPDWLEKIRDALEPGVLVGANLRYDAHGDVDGVRLPYLDGWCLAGMTEDLRRLGGWDESYREPSYYGDNDLSLRARAEGMVLREVQTGLRHLVGRTAIDGDPRKTAAATFNRERFAAMARDLLAA